MFHSCEILGEQWYREYMKSVEEGHLMLDYKTLVAEVEARVQVLPLAAVC